MTAGLRLVLMTCMQIKCILQTDLGHPHCTNGLQSIGTLMEALQHLHCSKIDFTKKHGGY